MSMEWQGPSDSALGERDVSVLHVIGEEGLTSFSFDGLKRRLGVHPETLSRILYRLEEMGILEKGFDGYMVTSKAKELLSAHPSDATEPQLTLLETLLSPDVPVHEVVSHLRGKWFGILRWLGYSENAEGTTLKWVTEDGGIQVSAIFSNDSLRIEAKPLRGKNLNNALKASYQLIGYVAKLYGRLGRARPVAYFTAFNPYFTSG